MRTTTDKEVKQWMSDNVASYYNGTLMEVNESQLAEDCYQHFHPDWSGSPIPEVWYEYSLNIAIVHELKVGRHNYTPREAREELVRVTNFIYTEHSD